MFVQRSSLVLSQVPGESSEVSDKLFMLPFLSASSCERFPESFNVHYSSMLRTSARTLRKFSSTVVCRVEKLASAGISQMPEYYTKHAYVELERLSNGRRIMEEKSTRTC